MSTHRSDASREMQLAVDPLFSEEMIEDTHIPENDDALVVVSVTFVKTCGTFQIWRVYNYLV